MRKAGHSYCGEPVFESKIPNGHFAPVFGACLRELKISRETSARIFFQSPPWRSRHGGANEYRWPDGSADLKVMERATKKIRVNDPFVLP